MVKAHDEPSAYMYVCWTRRCLNTPTKNISPHMLQEVMEGQEELTASQNQK